VLPTCYWDFVGDDPLASALGWRPVHVIHAPMDADQLEMERTMTLLRLAPAWAAVALLLVGCGGGGGASNTARPTPSAPVSQRFTPHPLGEPDAPSGYYEYLPPGYGDGMPRPLLIFLHGYGENGDGSSELYKVLDGGLPALVQSDQWPLDRPFIVLAPQHRSPPDDPAYTPCGTGGFAGSCVMKIQHEKGHPASGTPCATPMEIEKFLAYATAKFAGHDSWTRTYDLSAGNDIYAWLLGFVRP
jgi:hypothetical protein